MHRLRTLVICATLIISCGGQAIAITPRSGAYSCQPNAVVKAWEGRYSPIQSQIETDFLINKIYIFRFDASKSGELSILRHIGGDCDRFCYEDYLKRAGWHIIQFGGSANALIATRWWRGGASSGVETLRIDTFWRESNGRFQFTHHIDNEMVIGDCHEIRRQ